MRTKLNTLERIAKVWCDDRNVLKIAPNGRVIPCLTNHPPVRATKRAKQLCRSLNIEQWLNNPTLSNLLDNRSIFSKWWIELGTPTPPRRDGLPHKKIPIVLLKGEEDVLIMFPRWFYNRLTLHVGQLFKITVTNHSIDVVICKLDDVLGWVTYDNLVSCF